MTPSQLRTALNSFAGACTTAAVGVTAMGHPIVALVFGSIATFLLGWSNFTKPGDAKPDELPPVTQPDPPNPTSPTNPA